MALKTVIRGLLIQMGATRKRKGNKEKERLLEDLKQIEAKNKLNPSKKLTKQVNKINSELHALSLTTMERQMRKLNLIHYTQGNKAGKTLARRLKTHYLQSKLPYMTSAANTKLYNPQDIVEELASFYDTLYNLQ
ncbi:Hypothetical predicted protein [Pelobates cultripes]|uniref:Uncharacterized protein n=1 Tax=Pelobates cultripes TaxID=61616 RepID=A0AAD1TDA9_PELCU|nr:Hypothetical predicted protein [Pelobates cultripes]